ncbi:antitoxin of toxin-antitoxin stability system [Salinarimonas ramus]|uniref:Antitoxin of toxin-antitoxin stability system n=1 Tax=Salinarimonas ramus TaxID=690164 RepID=A0A917Q5G0_9HYPH|nr:antitoxin of toxin-antitoxin stability system [Salinarimonas ramus]GGK23639.1 hypothetical protein GCM10011322_07920 [Salinarimonas ramus]
MPDEAELTIQLDADLRDAFLGEAALQDVPPADILRELVRSYVDDRRKCRDEVPPEYDAFLRAKVERSRASINAGRWRSNEDVEAEFAERRRRLAADSA